MAPKAVTGIEIERALDAEPVAEGKLLLPDPLCVEPVAPVPVEVAVAVALVEAVPKS